MSIRTLIIATAGVAVLTAGAASAQPVVASHPVPNPPVHKTVIVKHRHGHKVVKVVRHHHGHKTVVKKDILVNKK